jgi:hypothetical protein
VIAALAVLVPASGVLAAPAARDIASPRPVVVIGVPGLRWTDISPSQTPAIWQLASGGSVGSLVVSAVRTFTCPADAWLTLNSGARATVTQQPIACRLPEVLTQGTRGPTARAWVPAIDKVRRGSIEIINKPYSYAPCWGVLGGTNSPGASCPPPPKSASTRCVTGIGPGAALALASPTGVLDNYSAAIEGPPGPALRQCPLTIVDLGAVPALAPGALAPRPGNQD